MDPKTIEQAFYLMLIMGALDALLYYKYNVVICPLHGLERVR